MRIDGCNNIGDFRSMARRRLPGPIFHYIDGAADDEVTYRRNTEAYERCDLVPKPLQPPISGPPAILQSTHEAALDVVDLADLKRRALELS